MDRWWYSLLINWHRLRRKVEFIHSSISVINNNVFLINKIISFLKIPTIKQSWKCDYRFESNISQNQNYKNNGWNERREPNNGYFLQKALWFQPHSNVSSVFLFQFFCSLFIRPSLVYSGPWKEIVCKKVWDNYNCFSWRDFLQNFRGDLCGYFFTVC